MRRIVTTTLLGGLLAAGAWALWHHEQIHSLSDAVRLAQSQFGGLLPEVLPGDGVGAPARLAGFGQAPAGDRLRIATFNIRAFGEGKAADPVVAGQIVTICAQFDLVAIQEVRNQDQTALAGLAGALSGATGRPWTFVASPPQGRTHYYREQAAFLFDQSRVRLDEATGYTVSDPDGLLVRAPFVGWFRAASVQPELAFTFSLVNVHLNPEQPARELVFLRNLFRAVRNDGRGEDDVIILGDFNAGDSLLAASAGDSRLAWVVREGFTNTRGTSQYDNIVFDPLATTEYCGSGGVFDFLKHLNLNLEQALAVSDHLPVYAEFGMVEGGLWGGTALPRQAVAVPGDSPAEALPARPWH